MAPTNLPSDRRKREIKENPYGTKMSRCGDQVLYGFASGFSVGAFMSGIGGALYARSLKAQGEPWVFPVIKVVAAGAFSFGSFLGLGAVFRCDDFDHSIIQGIDVPLPEELIQRAKLLPEAQIE